MITLEVKISGDTGVGKTRMILEEFLDTPSVYITCNDTVGGVMEKLKKVDYDKWILASEGEIEIHSCMPSKLMETLQGIKYLEANSSIILDGGYWTQDHLDQVKESFPGIFKTLVLSI